MKVRVGADGFCTTEDEMEQEKGEIVATAPSDDFVIIDVPDDVEDYEEWIIKNHPELM